MVGDAFHRFIVRIPGNGFGINLPGVFIPDQYHTCMCCVQGTPGAFEQARTIRPIQAAQLAAEIEQQVHFLQAAARLIQQGNVLQDYGRLARDLVIHLQVSSVNAGMGSGLTASIAATILYRYGSADRSATWRAAR